MCACKNTTINLTKANVNQIASKNHVTEVLCDDMFVRKKCLMTHIVNKVNLNVAGDHWKMAF